MKFLLDIPIGRSTCAMLQSAGHDVVHVSEVLSGTAKDPDILAYAARENRTIICFDLDFGTLVARSRQALPSVITFRTSGRKADIINRHLSRLLPEIHPELTNGVLVTVEDHRVRIRRLPIGG